MTKKKTIFLILIFLVLVAFVLGFICWSKYLKTETEIKPAGTPFPVGIEPSKGGSGGLPQ